MSGDQMIRLTDQLSTKSDKIRVLHRAGYSRRQIADFLGIRYQFVRNVLVDDERRGQISPLSAVEPGAPKPQSKAANKGTFGSPESHSGRPASMKVRIEAGGRIALPQGVREALSLQEGDTLIAVLEGDGIHLLTLSAAVRRAQAIVRKYVPEGVSLVDELLEERRREVSEELHDA
jgi:AbrB family looped-hinge helix DNA binding protein